jgi:hypothetical protein
LNGSVLAEDVREIRVESSRDSSGSTTPCATTRRATRAARRAHRGPLVARASRLAGRVALVAFALFARAETAHAFGRGVAFHGCDGCHASGEHRVEVMAIDPVMVGVAGRVRIRMTDLNGSRMGFFVNADRGTLAPGTGAKRNGDGLTHDGPPSFGGGVFELELRWTPQQGAARLAVSTLDANGDGRSSGDLGRFDTFDFVAGCEGRAYYEDLDRDGFGGERTRLFCEGEPGEGYVAEGGDCNDLVADVHPGAAEPCNQRDDDCNGVVDDDAVDVMHYPDADRDGYYSLRERESGEELFGCSEIGGPWAARPGDCAPDDAAVHPDATEVCNLVDDDCDGDTDERTRPQCGTGWCRRNADSCDPDDCRPGPPNEETCNVFDDDCDGLIDEELRCEAGTDAGSGVIRRDAGIGAGGGGSGGCAAGGGGGAGGLAMLVLLLVRRRHRPLTSCARRRAVTS